MSDDAVVRIGGGAGTLAAGLHALGAELQWLRDPDGRDLLWDGDPVWWTGRAPLLFPIVGEVAGGVIRVAGTAHPMGRHGFARRSAFALAGQDATSVTFRLADDAATRAAYPFRFRLDVTYRIEGRTLALAAELHNPGTAPLPASFGFHPALRWPLPYGRPRADHRLRFDAPEPEPVRRLDAAGLVRPEPQPTPVAGRDLALADALFADDALILDRPRSRRLVYGAPGAPGVRVDFDGMPQLGIWTKPGAPFLCIEPWHGMADPVGYAGEFAAKPGVIEVAPDASRCFSMRIGVEDGTFG